MTKTAVILITSICDRCHSPKYRLDLTRIWVMSQSRVLHRQSGRCSSALEFIQLRDTTSLPISPASMRILPARCHTPDWFRITNRGTIEEQIKFNHWQNRESGGIGRRTRLRIWRVKPWGFESPLSHQSLKGRSLRPALPLAAELRSACQFILLSGVANPLRLPSSISNPRTRSRVPSAKAYVVPVESWLISPETPRACYWTC